MRGAERTPQRRLRGYVIAVVIEPDSIQVLGIFHIAHGGKRYVDDPVDIVVPSCILARNTPMTVKLTSLMRMRWPMGYRPE